jgi:hypothetical protein
MTLVGNDDRECARSVTESGVSGRELTDDANAGVVEGMHPWQT